ncbi:MAG TPA: hypothetical protein VMB34_29165 [Acetobacteraceae bacterium]|nr:hypothetical protein [Acetobacteraceae bacterium]
MTGLRDALRERLARHTAPAAGSQPALPAPDGAAPTGEADMAELVARMRAAARQAGIDDDGPLTPLLETFMLTLARLGALTDRNARITTEHAAALAATLGQARRAADAETERFHAHLDAAKAKTVRDVAIHIAHSADDALARRVRVFDRNSTLIAAAVLVGSILAAAAGGYWWGNSAATAAIRETESGLQAAFNNGPTAARDWLNLMTWNDVTHSLSLCHGDSISIQQGRRACMVPFWIEKPVSPPPPQTGG